MAPLLAALALGVIAGVVLQRGDFCLHGALREACSSRRGPRLRAWMLAMGLLMALGAVASPADLVPRAVPAPAIAVFTGGVLFGVGMVLARACALTIWSRLGTGSVGSLAAAAAFTATVVVAAPRGPLVALLRGGDALALPARASVPAPIVLLGALIGVTVLFVRSPLSPEPRRWPWPLTGLAVAGVVVAAVVLGGGGEGLSALRGARGLVTGAVGTGAQVDGMAAILAGIPMGSWLSARTAGPLSWRVPGAGELTRRVLGGMLMGVGAVAAGGCGAAHALGGAALLAPAALLALAGIAVGGATAVCMAGRHPAVEVRRVRAARHHAALKLPLLPR